MKKRIYDAYVTDVTAAGADAAEMSYADWEAAQAQYPVKLPKWMETLLRIPFFGQVFGIIMLIILIPLVLIVVLLGIVLYCLCLPINICCRCLCGVPPTDEATAKEREAFAAAAAATAPQQQASASRTVESV